MPPLGNDYQATYADNTPAILRGPDAIMGTTAPLVSDPALPLPAGMVYLADVLLILDNHAYASEMLNNTSAAEWLRMARKQVWDRLAVRP